MSRTKTDTHASEHSALTQSYKKQSGFVLSLCALVLNKVWVDFTGVCHVWAPREREGDWERHLSAPCDPDLTLPPVCVWTDGSPVQPSQVCVCSCVCKTDDVFPFIMYSVIQPSWSPPSDKINSAVNMILPAPALVTAGRPQLISFSHTSKCVCVCVCVIMNVLSRNLKA